jgi:hypothetical protein
MGDHIDRGGVRLNFRAQESGEHFYSGTGTGWTAYVKEIDAQRTVFRKKGGELAKSAGYG